MKETTAKCVNIVTECMDILCLFPTLSSPTEQKALFFQCIDAMGSYPKPSKKGDGFEPKGETLGAYLCISNVRNVLKLGLLGVMNYTNSYDIATLNLELALSLLLA